MSNLHSVDTTITWFPFTKESTPGSPSYWCLVGIRGKSYSALWDSRKGFFVDSSGNQINHIVESWCAMPNPPQINME